MLINLHVKVAELNICIAVAQGCCAVELKLPIGKFLRKHDGSIVERNAGVSVAKFDYKQKLGGENPCNKSRSIRFDAIGQKRGLVCI